MRLLDLTPQQVQTFWSKVSFADGCWMWTASFRETGYGQFQTGDKNWRVHRLSYEMLVGPVPIGLDLDHLCRNRGCLNPSHLEPVTRSVNLSRSQLVAAAVNKRKSHCPRGHEYTAENTRRTRPGGRACRACAALRKAAA